METTKDESEPCGTIMPPDAIEYCATILKLPQFHGSEATVKFQRMFDHLASSVQT